MRDDGSTMNDPHVKAIHYFIEHDDSVDYRDAAPLAYGDDLFCVRADKGEVVLEPKDHYATEEEAKRASEAFVRRWEFQAALSAGSRSFKLLYARVDIIDHNPPPPPGLVIAGPMNFHFRVPEAQVRVTKMLTGYPAPPSDQAIDPDDPDASFMLSRLDLYRQGREPLAGVANLCLTVLEDSALQASGGKGNKRKAAANHYQIAMTVLSGVAMLSAKRGGPVAPHPSAVSVVVVGKDLDPVALHDPLVAELGGSELALSYQALHRFRVDTQDLGSLNDVNVVPKHGTGLL